MRDKLSPLAFALALFLIGLTATAQESKPPAVDPDAPFEIASVEGAAIAVPRGWENLDKFTPSVLIFRKNKSNEAAAQTPSEPQIQIILEKIRIHPPIEQAMGVVAQRILAEPATDMVSRPAGENIKLADGTPAMIMTIEVIREGKKRQLILKVLAKSDDKNGFIVTGTVSAPKESKIPTADSAETKWLRELVKSLVLNPEKLDTQKVKDAFTDRDKK